ncbi:hypothetical protein [Flavobacterium sp.]|jgi:hypothetical protein|uniref:energy transducer TonB n=1 Tax=Flavobacterium sp. TaxID=239 RepID=UPI0022C2731E|nr:hypothetical protein [Flavobacterium sp.]MCZ8229528.1 hypothetical protein [Flavobacterium sp.]
MERKYKITIPEPCHEDWNKMSPNDDGRFCMSCAKTVVDFTTMLPKEVQHFFLQKQNKQICGRMRKSQLDTITIQIPSHVLYTQTQYQKIFLLALLIAMGSTLFSCTDKKGNKQKIDKVKVVNEPKPATDRITVGDVKYNPNDPSHVPPPPPPPKIDQVKFVKPIVRPEDKSEINKIKDPYIDDTIYGGMGICVYPEYIGGFQQFYTYIKDNYQFPKEAKKISGTISATFKILKDGKLDSIEVTKDPGFGTKQELIKILKNTKKWLPGEEFGKKKEYKFQLNISIKLDTLKRTFFRRKVNSKIDSIEIKRITKFEDDYSKH